MKWVAGDGEQDGVLQILISDDYNDTDTLCRIQSIQDKP